MLRQSRILLCFLAISAFVRATPPADPPTRPRLVLAVVVDQFRYDYLLRFRADYHEGLDRLLTRGAVFTDAHYLHATTVTAVGHSTVLSGAPPSVSGIIGNEWYDRATSATVTSVSDPAAKVVGGIPNMPGSSPHRLLVSTVSDELKMQGGDSKTIGVSIKDRSAILPAGHMADAAYWYDSDSNNWVTSTYYTKELPAWVQSLNGERTYQHFLGAQWFPFDAQGETGKPFCTMVAGQETRYCGGLEATPWGNEMIEQFAERAIAGENLGRHTGTDVLTVSFSSNDYVGHAVGPDDPAVRDISIRTDRLLGKLLDFVDGQVGAGNTLIVLTADHGVAPVPEVNQARNMPGGRIDAPAMRSAIVEALTKRFGPGDWILPSPSTMPYFNRAVMAKYKADPVEVQRVAAAAVAAQKHIARVFTAHDLEVGAVQQDVIGRAFSLSYFAPRAGDLMILQEPYYLFDTSGTSHGTPYVYDNEVPVLFMGPRIKPGIYPETIAVNDIAPTLAALLGVAQPSGSIGRVLAEMIQQ